MCPSVSPLMSILFLTSSDLVFSHSSFIMKKQLIILLFCITISVSTAADHITGHYYDGKLYYWNRSKQKFDHHRDSCEKSGGSLVMIRSKEENSFLLSLVNDCTFIGAECSKDHYEWMDSSVLSYSNFPSDDSSCDKNTYPYLDPVHHNWGKTKSKKEECGSICVDSVPFSQVYKRINHDLDDMKKSSKKLASVQLVLRRTLKRWLGIDFGYDEDDDEDSDNDDDNYDHLVPHLINSTQSSLIQMMREQKEDMRRQQNLMIGLLITTGLCVLCIFITILIISKLSNPKTLKCDTSYPSTKTMNTTLDGVYVDPQEAQVNNNEYLEINHDGPGGVWNTNTLVTTRERHYSNIL